MRWYRILKPGHIRIKLLNNTYIFFLRIRYWLIIPIKRNSNINNTVIIKNVYFYNKK